jgi:hypothetical protein
MEMTTDRINLIGTCHSCRMRGLPTCEHPKRYVKHPELGCTSWASGIKGQENLPLEHHLPKAK